MMHFRARGYCWHGSVFVVLSAILICCGSSHAAPVQWTSGTGANGHFYDRINQTGLTFAQAVAAAAGSTFNGLPGHLVIFDNNNYANEFSFVDNNVYLGAQDSRIYWAGAQWDGVTGTDRDHWFWLDATNCPTSITNGWQIGQFEGPGLEGVGCCQFYSPPLCVYSDA